MAHTNKPTPQTHPDIEGFEDPGYILAISPKNAADSLQDHSITPITITNPYNNANTNSTLRHLISGNPLTSTIRITYNKSIQPNLPIALKHKGPARTNLVLGLTLSIIILFWLVTKAPAIGAAVFAFVVFGILGPLVG